MGHSLVNETQPATAAGWPAPESAPVAFLIEAKSPVERHLIDAWIRSERPPGTPESAVQAFSVEERPPADQLASFTDFLAALTPETWLTPIKVIWRPKDRRGRREGHLRDLLLIGNPHEPGTARQRWIDRRHPDRRVVAVAEPARLADLRTRWTAVRGAQPGAEDELGPSFSRFVGRQTVIALSRAETRLIGPRYKRPSLVQEEISARGSWRRGLAELSRRDGRSVSELNVDAAHYLEEMVASASPFLIDLKADFCRFMYQQAYDSQIEYEAGQMEEVNQLARQYPMALLFSHKTYVDGAVAICMAYDNGISADHIMGGINMDFALLGPFLRRAGVAFIRRGGGSGPVYRFVLREYVGFLAEKRFNLMWSPEGTRSRTGKLAPIKHGILVYVVRAYLEGRTDDFVISPWSIAYDELAEIAEFARYARGEPKQPESLSWFVRYLRGQRNRYGRVHVKVARPIFLRDFLGEPDPALAADESRIRNGVQRLGNEIASRMNEVMPITASAVISTLLLGGGERAYTEEQLRASCAELTEQLRSRDLPLVPELAQDVDRWLPPALESMVRHHAVSSEKVRDTLYSLDAGQALKVAYYRNTISHFFIPNAVTEIALRMAAASPDEFATTFWLTVEELHDFLQNAFFLPDLPQFKESVAAELKLADIPGPEEIANGDAAATGLVDQLRLHGASLVLGSFLESYSLFADALAAVDPAAPVEVSGVLTTARKFGRQYYLQRRNVRPEAISESVMEDAVEVARRRGLLEVGTADLQARRRAFAATIAGYLSSIGSQDNDLVVKET